MKPDLFPKPPRKPPRVLMHVADAGNSDDPEAPYWCEMKCGTCGHREEWKFDTVTAARRGIPCSKCNPQELPK